MLLFFVCLATIGTLWLALLFVANVLFYYNPENPTGEWAILKKPYVRFIILATVIGYLGVLATM
ncbi:MAG: hypothetical protein ABIG87_03350 [Patescibacteria group bacterium]